jgi:hypothetical protein
LPLAGRVANLIVASTFYHVILAHLIVRDPRFAGASLLVVNPRRAQMAALCEPLAHAPDSPFAATISLPDIEGGKPDRERAQGRWLAQLDATVRAERVFVFTDLTPELQLLCRRAEARGARTFCAEDGGAAYSSRSAASPWRRHWQRIVRFGPWVENVAASGSSRHVQTYLALHAELVRPELQRKPILSLQAAPLPQLLGASWIDAFLAHFGVTRELLVCDELYALARNRATAGAEQVQWRLADELRAARQAGRECIVKYHPSESGDRLDAAALGARVLPAAVPVELVYLASGRRLGRVIGDAGTTLLSARWLAPHARALSVLELAGIDDPWYARTLDRLGVQRLGPSPPGAVCARADTSGKLAEG